MPRRSPGDLEAALWRSRRGAPPPPRGIGARAARIWRQAIASLPVDALKEGAHPMLRNYCVLAANAEHLGRKLAAHPDNKAVRAELLKVSAAVASLGVKLRLAPSSRLRAADGRLGEGNPLANLHPLLADSPAMREELDRH